MCCNARHLEREARVLDSTVDKLCERYDDLNRKNYNVNLEWLVTKLNNCLERVRENLYNVGISDLAAHDAAAAAAVAAADAAAAAATGDADAAAAAAAAAEEAEDAARNANTEAEIAYEDSYEASNEAELLLEDIRKITK